MTRASPRHFLSLRDLEPGEFEQLIERARELKTLHRAGQFYEPLRNRVLGMLFEKSSTRTRISFESAMIQLGGGTVFLSPNDTHLGRGEPIEDTARVLSSMVDVITVRTFAHERIERIAAYSRVPVINSLTDSFHPCQLLADMQTYAEHRGSIKGRTVAWIGDGNNMCNSYINAAAQLEFELRIACPAGFEPDRELLDATEPARLVPDPATAGAGADLLVTDVWASMGQEEEQIQRSQQFSDYCVDAELLSIAKSDAVVMHCLPAHRGEEITDEVLDGPQSIVWDEAENRLHAQKALLEFLLCGQ